MKGKTAATWILILLLCAGTLAGVVWADRQENGSATLSQTMSEKTSSGSKTNQKETTEKNQKTQGKVPKNETQEAKTQKETTQQEKLAAEFAKEKQEWYLRLANVDHPLPEDFTVETQEVQNGYKLDSRIAAQAKEMIEAARQDGVELLVCSAYRSIEKQTNLFNKMKQDYLAQGYSEEQAYAKTATAIAIPGTSEHQSGLAADIVTPSHQTLDPAFAETAAGQWLVEHAHEYGFVLRYPEEKQDITKIIYESWHFRFVGKTHAKLMKEQNLCLEEYLELEVPKGYTGIRDPFEDPAN